MQSESSAPSISEPISQPRSSFFTRRGATLTLVALLALAAALRLWLLSRDVPVLDSDEATIGLMGLHLQHGQVFVFFWGQYYMGSLEAILAAPFLWLLGPSAFTLRLAPMLLGLAFIFTVYLLGSRLYSRTVALLTVALLAIGPPFFVVLSVRAYGGYVETLLLGNLLLLLALAGESPRGRTFWRSVLLGALAGLALWVDPLVIPYLLAVVVIFVWQRRRDLLGWNGIALLIAAFAGMIPLLASNIRHGGTTIMVIRSLLVFGSSGSHTAHAPLLLVIAKNLLRAFAVSLPIVTGGFLGGTQGAGFTPHMYLRNAAADPIAYGLALLIEFGAVALFCAALIRVLQASPLPRLLLRRRSRGDYSLEQGANTDSDASPAQALESENPSIWSLRTRQQGEVTLMLVALCYLGALCLSSKPVIFSAPRYLFPLFAVLPVVINQAYRWFTWLSHRFAQRQGAFAIRPIVPLALVVLLLCGWNLAGDIALTPIQTAASDHNVWIDSQDAPLIAELHAHHVHSVISNDYWEGLRLTFESGETIITVMVLPDGHPGLNRYAPYVAQGLADPRPAYLGLTGTPEAQSYMELMGQGSLPGYTSEFIGPYTVLLPPAQ